ncbi:TIGR02594 family protein [Burkholderia plantarii]|uniref:Peptidase C51 domain-containing protein n=1 Tax=Burkholderia plantarii TaxID=41899 RepID=A0A0B6S9H3_BURPL|nr:TIGR02594 family protein [Burkholderia plantarii]AJK48881.1 hypothetical protein BGL_2c07970 [Burkholderia plantarii]
MTPLAPWMPVAFAEAGVARGGPGHSNPRIVEYHGATRLAGYDDKVAWCSSFVNWCLAQVGFAGTGSALARSWLDWGRPLDAPVHGCIVVLTRGAPDGWQGHVGFYLRHEGDAIVLFGGNQLDTVRELAYDASQWLGYRWPATQALRPGS